MSGGKPLYPPHITETEPALTTLVRQLRATRPFLIGFAVTGFLITQVALGVTDEDVKNSKFANPEGAH